MWWDETGVDVDETAGIASPPSQPRITEPPLPDVTKKPNDTVEKAKIPEKVITPEITAKATSTSDVLRCFGSTPDQFKCYREYYGELIAKDGAKPAIIDIKGRYADSFVKSQCHQLMHIIGRASADKYKTVAEAFQEGDPFCWSGYYHGVMEGVALHLGREKLAQSLDIICAGIPGKERFSFDYYNCVHGLGHGIMAILNDELMDTLAMCDNLSGSWEQSSCWSGAFMENIIANGIDHRSKYLKDNDPHYPCDAVDEKYKGVCYIMQTSRMLALTGYDFVRVYALCAAAEEPYINICYQSLGRDASGSTVSDVERTKAYCLLGKDNRQQSNCVIGAVKDFISYFHSDKQAREFCSALPEDLQSICTSTAESYYLSFRPS